ncbi:hypothetical protein [Crassaminicella indica]|uniref:Uncharacterized protein n=1 Tax=Crassaminicella indica TaxID=2855394 RepID=A0ABX8RDD5_9CLOT|nr:hypothetical protein [Crassaminicella indica]QXM07080.1 hypothetical protein KVH43_05055 [Crassaminicella indica]
MILQHYIQDALDLAVTRDPKKINKAIELMDTALREFHKDKFSLTRAYSTKGLIYEYYSRDFYRAYECYTKWGEIGGKLKGYEFDRIRSFMRANKFQYSKKFFSLVEDMQKVQIHIPTKQIRFWMSIAATIIYSYEARYDAAKQMAKGAIFIFNEKETSLKTMLKSNKLLDHIDVTEEEMKLVWQFAKKGKI